MASGRVDRLLSSLVVVWGVPRGRVTWMVSVVGGASCANWTAATSAPVDAITMASDRKATASAVDHHPRVRGTRMATVTKALKRVRYVPARRLPEMAGGARKSAGNESASEFYACE
jgi:hypothetical protein